MTSTSLRSGPGCRLASLLALLAFAACGPAPAGPEAASPPSSQVIAFVGASVVTLADGGGPVPDQTVLVEDGRILRVGARGAVEVPAGARVIEGRGKYLMPGLADMHVHLEHFPDPALLGLFLANGVTTVRNMDGRPEILEWRRQVRDGSLLGPTIYTAGPLLDGDPPRRPDNTVVKDAAEARAAVLAQADAGYDFIKVYSNVSSDAYQAILAAARERGLPVAGHVPGGVSLEEVLAGGQAAIEHLGDYDDAIEAEDSPFKGRYQWFKRLLAMPMDPARAKAIAELQAERGVWTVPTLVQADRALAPPDVVREWLAAPEMAYVPADAREFWLEARTSTRLDEADWQLVPRGRAQRLALLGTLREAGVPLLVGTDTPNPFVVPGFAVHEELRNFVAAGFTPAAALAAASREAARFLGELDRWGAVEPGQRADLLLLDADPLADLANLRQPAGVMVRGRWLPREELDRLLAALREPGDGEGREGPPQPEVGAAPPNP